MDKVGKHININRHQPTEQPRHLKGSIRVKAMEAVLTKTFLALNQNTPTEKSLTIKAMVFCEDLEDIPTVELDYCFRQARLNRNDSFLRKDPVSTP